MWWLIPLAGGFILGGKGKPKTPVKKIKALGTKTGITWEVDDFHTVGLVVVSGHGGYVSFRRDGKGFKMVSARGAAKAVEAIRKDFES